MKIKSLLAAFAAAVILLTSSCNSDEPSNGTMIYLDIVTVASRTETGTTLTCRQGADTPLVTYYTSQPITGNVIKEGDRILIQYTADKGRFVNGAINILAATTVAGSGAPVPEEDFASLADPKGSVVTMNSCWRTGSYLNAVFLAHTSPNFKECRMMVDKSTLNDEYPVIRIVFQPENSFDQTNLAFYMSYSLDNITSNKNVKGVRVYFNDPSQKQDYVEISCTPTGLTPIQPTE